MSEWQKFRIDEIATKTAIGPFGSRMKSDTYTQFGVPVIRGTNITSGRSFSGDWVYVSEKDADQLASCNVREGDLVFPHRGAIGEVGIVPGDRERYLLSSSLMSLKCDETKADSLYLYYFFKSHEGRHQLLKNASQVGTPGIGQPLSSLRSIELYLPPVDHQKDIAKVLGCLDDKIELNRRMNETLEAMARTIFQSWFVDFDPVRAKASGESTDSICQRLGLTPELLALFPDSLEDSELGEIPEGWSPKVFSETIQIIGGGTPKTSVEDFWGGDVPWFSVVDAPNESDVFVIDTEKKITNMGLENSSTKLLPEGITIISARGTVGKVALVAAPMAMNQSCYGLRGKNGCDVYTYYATRQLVSSLKRHGHGAVFDTITRDTFASVKAVTCDAISKAFDAMVAPNMQRIKANGFHTARLVELRDSLLPKLLTGELSLIVGGAL